MTDKKNTLLVVEDSLDLQDLTKEDMDTLRPGFSGRAKIDCGTRTVGYVVTRKFWDYLRINWLL